MKIIKLNGRLTSEEKETHLSYDYIDKIWVMDTTIMKHYNKSKKQQWIQLAEYVYDDGTVCGGVFEAPSYAVTIRSTIKKQMSDKQLENLSGSDDE
jgi:hypothetical protein